MEKDNIHSIRNCKSRMDFVGSAVLLLIPIITLEIIGVLKTTISFFVLGNHCLNIWLRKEQLQTFTQSEIQYRAQYVYES